MWRQRLWVDGFVMRMAPDRGFLPARRGTPDEQPGSVVVRRIRLTSSRSTRTTYTFAHSRSSDGVLATESLSSCAAPGCATVFVVEGVSARRVFDASNLSLELPPSSRLYMYTDADIGSANQTLEVYYQQK